MRWFVSKAEKVSRSPSRRLSIEQVEDRVCLTTVILTADSCGIEDDANHVSTYCEDHSAEHDSTAFEATERESGGEVTDLRFNVGSTKVVSTVDTEPSGPPKPGAGIEGSDIGSGADDPDLERVNIKALPGNGDPRSDPPSSGGTTGGDGGTTGGDGGTTGGDWDAADSFQDDDLPMG